MWKAEKDKIKVTNRQNLRPDLEKPHQEKLQSQVYFRIYYLGHLRKGQYGTSIVSKVWNNNL